MEPTERSSRGCPKYGGVIVCGSSIVTVYSLKMGLSIESRKTQPLTANLISRYKDNIGAFFFVYNAHTIFSLIYRFMKHNYAENKNNIK